MAICQYSIYPYLSVVPRYGLVSDELFGKYLAEANGLRLWDFGPASMV